MRDKAQDEIQMAIKRKVFLEKGFELFSEKTIEAVSMQDVADASTYGVATLYRYFGSKPGLVVAVATWKWEQYREEYLKNKVDKDPAAVTAAEHFSLYLDSFLELYRNHKDLLRFNQFFNIYIESEDIDDETISPYRDLVQRIVGQFHDIYRRAEADHTLRTDIPEEEMFSSTIHLMLAAVTRYAVGLVYSPGKGYDEGRELVLLRNMLFEYYTL